MQIGPTGMLGGMVPHVIEATQNVVDEIKEYPKGLVGILTHFLGRYREFDVALQMVLVPPGSPKYYYMGVDLAASLNTMAEELMSNDDLQWLWMLGDDHVFANDLWLKLYRRGVDIVVPLCLRRDGFSPVLNDDFDHGYKSIHDGWKYLEGKTGLLKWHGICGNAGMLVHKHVFEKLEKPWFRAGQLHPGYQSVDLYFAREAQKAGFDLNIDLDNHIGHIEHMAIWPMRSDDGLWHVEIRQATS